jgi:tetratricopeptide (TPR) repeat protein
VSESIGYYRKTVAIRQEIAQVDPKNERATTSLASAYRRLGLSLLASGQTAEAIDHLRRGLALKTPPSETSVQVELASAYNELAGESGKPAEARARRERARALLANLQRDHELNADGERLLKEVAASIECSRASVIH